MPSRAVRSSWRSTSASTTCCSPSASRKTRWPRRRRTMAEARVMRVPPVRAEFENTTLDAAQVGEVARPLSIWERVTNIDWVRRVVILIVLAVIWEAYARYINNGLMFPTFLETVQALWDA